MTQSLAALPKIWSANPDTEFTKNSGDVRKEQPSSAAAATSSCDDVLEVSEDLDYERASDGNKADPSTAPPTTPWCEAILATPKNQAGFPMDSPKQMKDSRFPFEGRNGSYSTGC